MVTTHHFIELTGVEKQLSREVTSSESPLDINVTMLVFAVLLHSAVMKLSLVVAVVMLALAHGRIQLPHCSFFFFFKVCF